MCHVALSSQNVCNCSAWAKSVLAKRCWRCSDLELAFTPDWQCCLSEALSLTSVDICGCCVSSELTFFLYWLTSWNWDLRFRSEDPCCWLYVPWHCSTAGGRQYFGGTYGTAVRQCIRLDYAEPCPRTTLNKIVILVWNALSKGSEWKLQT